MKILHATTLSLAVATMALSGCNRSDDHQAADAGVAQQEAVEAQTVIGKAVQKEIEKARKELRDGNLVISGQGHVGFSIGGMKVSSGDKQDVDAPRAEISPRGDLLIEGKAVDVTPAQRKLLVDYREQVIGVAETGMQIGSKGADLAGTAVKEALGAIFSGGDTGDMEKRVEAQAETLKQEAKVICKQLPVMLATQQQLAATLPEFKPYATMEQADIDDCMKDLDDEGVWAAEPE